MARGNAIKVLRTTRANLNSQAGLGNLLAGEVYLVTDESRLAVGLSTTTYADVAKAAGTTTNDNAASGAVGEFLEATRAVGAALSLTTTTATDLVSLSLTAGDWDVYGSIATAPDAGAIITRALGWLSTTSATIPTPPNAGAYVSLPFTGNPNQGVFAPVGQRRLSLSTTTTVYLTAHITFSGGTCTGYGYIGARRAR